jgi:alpha-acetolactate decarboxylase
MYKFKLDIVSLIFSMSVALPAIAGDLSCQSQIDVFTKANGVKGDYSAVAQLHDAKLSASSIGYGATEFLNDEITIVDGKIYLGRNDNGVIKLRSPLKEGDGVFKMIVASPEKWAAPQKTKAINSLKELSDFLDKVAEQTKCGTSSTFSFKLLALAKSIKWSVVNQVPGTDLTKTNSNEEVILVGVYSTQDKERLSISKALNMHVHVYLPQSNLAGHVIELELQEGGQLYLPTVTN